MTKFPNNLSPVKPFSPQSTHGSSAQQAVLIHLDGVGLSPEIYENYALETLEDQLMEIFQDTDIAEFDGNEIGPEEVVLYLYGPSAEKIFSEIEKTLRAYPLCQNARVVIRYGKPGAPEKEIQIKNKE